MENNQHILTPNISNILKIVALLMMFCLHFFNESWLVQGNSFKSVFHIGHITLEAFLGGIGNFCVSIFALLSGYGLFFNFIQSGSWNNTMKRVAAFVCSYWIVLGIVFLPLYLAFDNTISIKMFVGSFLAIDSTLNMFCWYVCFYVMAVVALYGWHQLSDQFQSKRMSMCVIALVIILVCPWLKIQLCKQFSDFMIYFPVMLAGYMIARYRVYDRLFEVIANHFSSWKQILLGSVGGGMTLLFLFLVRLCSQWAIYDQLDVLFSVIFVFGGILLFQPVHGKHEKLIARMGKATGNQWYLHAVFFGAYASHTQWIAYLPQYSLLVVLWTYILLLPSAILLDTLNKKISSWMNSKW